MAKRLNVPALGIAIGAVWGLAVLLITWLNALTGGVSGQGWFYPMVKALDYTYPGYGPGFWGGIWGAILGLVDGGICGVLIALIYNRLATPVEDTDDDAEEDLLSAEESD